MAATNDVSSDIKDKWIFLYVYPCIALLVIHIGNDNSLIELLRIPSYYSDVALSMSCVYLFGLYMRTLAIRINRQYNWTTDIRLRARDHALFGILIPSAVMLLIEILYLTLILRMSIGESSVFYLEMPLILIFCTAINALYAFLHFRAYGQNLDNLVNKLRTPTPAPKSSFIITQGAKTQHIPKEHVAYFKVIEKSTFLVTHDGKEYLYPGTLEQLAAGLNPNDFFQLNRQIVAVRKSILSYHTTETRKLLIDLSPRLEEVYVSKIKATTFMKWYREA